MAAAWLSPDDSTLEASVLTRGAIELLKAVILELELSYLNSSEALAACAAFLASEGTAPGSVVTRLLVSTKSEVVAIAAEVQARGEGWVSTISAQRNVIVMTALMNLPKPRDGN